MKLKRISFTALLCLLLCVSLLPVSAFADQTVIIVGGSVAIFNPVYVEAAAKKAKTYMNFPDSLHIEPARFGDDAGLIGAALLVNTGKE